MSDEKIILEIRHQNEEVMAYVIQKYSKLLWKIASAVLVNVASVQDVEECVAYGVEPLMELTRQEDKRKVWNCINELKLSKTTVLPHTTEKIEIDFSKGFDIEELEKGLPKGDWYYLVFTNNNFVFGQDWMCSVGFKGKQDDSTTVTTSIESEEESTVPAEYKLRFDDWLWPTESTTVCGNYTDHINISGNTGDDVYSVADGVVLETGFDTVYGNYVIMDFGNGVTVKYGHLKKILVESGDNLSSGKKIAILGQSGMATGPNLSFAVYADGEAVNPLSE